MVLFLGVEKDDSDAVLGFNLVPPNASVKSSRVATTGTSSDHSVDLSTKTLIEEQWESKSKAKERGAMEKQKQSKRERRSGKAKAKQKEKQKVKAENKRR
ncbi:hypothetical protein ACFX14_040981 [Malus domestica]